MQAEQQEKHIYQCVDHIEQALAQETAETLGDEMHDKAAIHHLVVVALREERLADIVHPVVQVYRMQQFRHTVVEPHILVHQVVPP